MVMLGPLIYLHSEIQCVKDGFKWSTLVICNSYTMHAKAASVLSARAQGRSPRARSQIKTDAAFACMVQLIYS